MLLMHSLLVGITTRVAAFADTQLPSLLAPALTDHDENEPQQQQEQPQPPQQQTPTDLLTLSPPKPLDITTPTPTDPTTTPPLASQNPQLASLESELSDCYQLITYYETTLAEERATSTTPLPHAEELTDLRLELAAKQSLITQLHSTLAKNTEHHEARLVELEMLRKEVSDAYEVIDSMEASASSTGMTRRVGGEEEDDEQGMRVRELEREVEEAGDRVRVLYEQVDRLSVQNQGLMEKLERKEMKLKSVEGKVKVLVQENRTMTAKQNEISGPHQDASCQTVLSCLTLQQAQNAIANMKMTKLENHILKRESEKEKESYTQKIAKDAEETAS
ncbi:hypothetical protein HDU98_005499, partial [Podochytrium sp. JEL0797]